jgi:hypothetical protein
MLVLIPRIVGSGRQYLDGEPPAHERARRQGIDNPGRFWSNHGEFPDRNSTRREESR